MRIVIKNAVILSVLCSFNPLLASDAQDLFVFDPVAREKRLAGRLERTALERTVTVKDLLDQARSAFEKRGVPFEEKIEALCWLKRSKYKSKPSVATQMPVFMKFLYDDVNASMLNASKSPSMKIKIYRWFDKEYEGEQEKKLQLLEGIMSGCEKLNVQQKEYLFKQYVCLDNAFFSPDKVGLAQRCQNGKTFVLTQIFKDETAGDDQRDAALIVLRQMGLDAIIGELEQEHAVKQQEMEQRLKQEQERLERLALEKQAQRELNRKYKQQKKEEYNRALAYQTALAGISKNLLREQQEQEEKAAELLRLKEEQKALEEQENAAVAKRLLEQKAAQRELMIEKAALIKTELIEKIGFKQRQEETGAAQRLLEQEDQEAGVAEFLRLQQEQEEALEDQQRIDQEVEAQRLLEQQGAASSQPDNDDKEWTDLGGERSGGSSAVKEGENKPWRWW